MCERLGERVAEVAGNGAPIEVVAFTRSPGLLLFIIFIIWSCSFAFESAFFSQSSWRISCCVRGRVTVNLRNCCRINGSSSGLHIFHFSRFAPCGSWKSDSHSIFDVKLR